MSKFSKLKKILLSSKTQFIMEAHNGISAKIVEESGFPGIWASGFSISASYGVRDCNEASWTQVLETIAFMSENTNIPILMDADTGFGDYNNFRRLVKKLETINVGGVCVEDKLFPKKNSFMSEFSHDLANTKEFCGKIKAAKDTQSNSDFCVVARTEGFISGAGLDEVLFRANAYCDAGADAILVHSRAKSAIEIIDFMKFFDRNIPIAIIPTTYYDTPTITLEKLGISLVIWANQNLRASVSAMKRISELIYSKKSVSNLDLDISPIEEIFKLTNVDELNKSMKKYLNL